MKRLFWGGKWHGQTSTVHDYIQIVNVPDGSRTERYHLHKICRIIREKESTDYVQKTTGCVFVEESIDVTERPSKECDKIMDALVERCMVSVERVYSPETKG